MTSLIITDPAAGDIPPMAAEIARLRLALATTAVHARAVLEARDQGGLALALSGYPAYAASSALAHLEECVTRVLAGDWLPLSQGHIDQAWERHSRSRLFTDSYMTRRGFQAAINDLLWHPERQFPAAALPPVMPLDGKVGFAEEVAGSYGHQMHGAAK